jgi:hypothetical protein
MVARRPVSRGGSTAMELAAKFGKTQRTIRNYVAEPRADYEARSVEQTKPWVALGISRRTWYRRNRQRFGRPVSVTAQAAKLEGGCSSVASPEGPATDPSRIRADVPERRERTVQQGRANEEVSPAVDEGAR